MGGKGTFGPGIERKANRVGALDGVWRVRRESGLLPPLYGMSKHISGKGGETRVGPLRFRFDVDDGKLRYRGVLTGLVDELEPGLDSTRGRAVYRGRELGRFSMSREETGPRDN
jgi:hypothetical protein